MKFRMVGRFLSMMGALAWLLPALATDDVTWMTENFPPIFIYDGEFAGRGAGDLSQDYLIHALSGFTHHVVRANTSRFVYEMSHKDGVCYWGAFRSPDREKIMVFPSRPILTPGFRLVTLEQRLSDFARFLTADQAIDLEILKGNSAMSGAYLADQPYSAAVGNFIADSARLVRLEKMTQFEQLYGLLSGNRVDFIFGNGLEVPFYALKLRASGRLRALPIKGSLPYNRGYVACSNGPIGRAVVAAIDLWLTDPNHWAQFIAPLQSWVPPVDFAAARDVQ